MAKNSGPVRTVHARTTGKERDEMIATTKAEIEKKFGQGSIMRYGDGGPESSRSRPFPRAPWPSMPLAGYRRRAARPNRRDLRSRVLR